MFLLTNSPEAAPDVPVYVEIEFEAAIPVAVDGQRWARSALLDARSTALGGEHGVGRVDLVENRFVGMKSRGVYETPGRHHPARGAPRARVAHARPRGAAPARLARPALRRDDLLRLLVLARARGAPGA